MNVRREFGIMTTREAECFYTGSLPSSPDALMNTLVRSGPQRHTHHEVIRCKRPISTRFPTPAQSARQALQPRTLSGSVLLIMQTHCGLGHAPGSNDVVTSLSSEVLKVCLQCNATSEIETLQIPDHTTSRPTRGLVILSVSNRIISFYSE